MVPNSNSRINPVATPTAKFIPNNFIQNFAVRSQNSSPLTTYKVSIIAIISASPNVSGTKIQWYAAVSANCARDQSTSERLISLNIR